MKVHFGPSCNENLVAHRNTHSKELMTLFDITQKLILEQNFEIPNVSSTEWTFTPWMRSTLLYDKVIKWTNAKVQHVHSNLVFCLGQANVKWKDQLQDFQQSHECRELFGIHGEPIEFE